MTWIFLADFLLLALFDFLTCLQSALSHFLMNCDMFLQTMDKWKLYISFVTLCQHCADDLVRLSHKNHLKYLFMSPKNTAGDVFLNSFVTTDTARNSPKVSLITCSHVTFMNVGTQS